MKYNPDKHHRQSTRLKNYDYTSRGAYFITLCTYQKQYLFGDIVEGEMVLNDMGKIIDEEWARSAGIRKEIELDEFVIMPSHVHGILWILPPDSSSNDRVAGNSPIPLPSNVGARGASPLQGNATTTAGTAKKSLGAFVGGFKGSCGKRINQLRGTPGVTIWHRNYHDHIIRNDKELNAIRQYIQLNPQNWPTDEENQ
jgi:putative transposase